MKLSELIGINKWIQLHKNAIIGWWYTYPSETHESQLGLLLPIYGKTKNVPNNQPDYIDENVRVDRYWFIDTTSQELGFISCKQ